jgi:DNA-binding LytR/AlgR family response regulator
MFSALVIEEDSEEARRLAAFLEDTWQVDVVRTACDASTGLRICSELRPDVAFLDIDMPGREGNNLAWAIGKLARPPRLVFTAKNADRAIDAFRFDAVDFLQKPLDAVRVAETVRRLIECTRLTPFDYVPDPTRRARAAAGVDQGFTDAVSELLPVTCVDRDQIRLLARREIVAVIRRGRRTWIHTVLEEFATYYPLAQVLRWLRDHAFVQIGRNAIVNLRALRSIRRCGDRVYRVQLQDRLATEITASRTGASRLIGIIRSRGLGKGRPDSWNSQNAVEIMPVGMASTATGTRKDENQSDPAFILVC